MGGVRILHIHHFFENVFILVYNISESTVVLYVGMTRVKMAAELNAYISFTLKRQLKLSSQPHEATEGLFYLVHD